MSLSFNSFSALNELNKTETDILREVVGILFPETNKKMVRFLFGFTCFSLLTLYSTDTHFDASTTDSF